MDGSVGTRARPERSLGYVPRQRFRLFSYHFRAGRSGVHGPPFLPQRSGFLKTNFMDATEEG